MSHASPPTSDVPSIDLACGARLEPGSIAAQVMQLPGATLSHHPAWEPIFHRALGHRSYSLVARVGDAVVGWLPLYEVRSVLFGKFLVSSPYLNYGGPLAGDPLIVQRLVSRAVALAEERGVRYLELRNSQPIDHPSLTVNVTNKVLMWRDLPSSEEELFKSYKPEVRNQIRKGRQNELDVRWGGLDQLNDFYRVFAVNMRDLGTPVYTKRLFGEMVRHLGGRAEICVVRLSGTPIACAIVLHGVGITEVPSASSLRAYNKTCANMLMYHHLLVRSMERGQHIFDFGRSSEDSGTYRFKKQWGARPVPSVWQYCPLKGDVGQVRPSNPKYQRRIELWKRLPLWMANTLGPRIVRGIP